MEKLQDKYSTEIEEVEMKKPKKTNLKSALAMTPEEHRQIGSTPMPKIEGRENKVAYIIRNLKALQEMQEMIKAEQDCFKKFTLQKIFNDMEQKLKTDAEYLAGQEDGFPADLLQEIENLP